MVRGLSEFEYIDKKICVLELTNKLVHMSLTG